MDHISDAISSNYFILGTKVQIKKAHSMTKVTVTLNCEQRSGHRSQVKVKFSKNLTFDLCNIEPGDMWGGGGS